MDSGFNIVFRGDWSNEQLSDMGMNVSDSFNPYFQMQNNFADQSLHNNLAAEYTDINGVQSIYYVTSLDLKRDKIYHEDPTQEVQRVFHVKISGDETIQADKVKFGRFVFEGMDESTIYLHRDAFFKRNYNSLKQNGIVPLLDPIEHSPSFSSRGGGVFNYRGYSAEQIFPKASDLIKPEWSGKLYEITDVRTEIPDQTFLQRRYFFSISIRQYRDDHRDVSQNTRIDGFNTDGFIEDKFDRSTDFDVAPNIEAVAIPTDMTSAKNYWKDEHVDEDGNTSYIIENKDSVLYRPPQVPVDHKNITDHPRYRPRPFGNA